MPNGGTSSLCRACVNIANFQGDEGSENCFAKHKTWPDIRSTMQHKVELLLAQTGACRAECNLDAQAASDLDLVNLRGYSFGSIATAIAYLATILESGLCIVNPDSAFCSHDVLNCKYAKVPVQSLAESGRIKAKLPTRDGVDAAYTQEDLTVGRVKRLMDGTHFASTQEANQYSQCLLRLARLVKRNTAVVSNGR